MLFQHELHMHMQWWHLMCPFTHIPLPPSWQSTRIHAFQQKTLILLVVLDASFFGSHEHGCMSVSSVCPAGIGACMACSRRWLDHAATQWHTCKIAASKRMVCMSANVVLHNIILYGCLGAVFPAGLGCVSATATMYAFEMQVRPCKVILHASSKQRV